MPDFQVAVEIVMREIRIGARGQLTLPRLVRKAAGLGPGDAVTFEVAGPGRVEVRALARMRLADALRQYRIVESVEDDLARGAWHERAAEDILGK